MQSRPCLILLIRELQTLRGFPQENMSQEEGHGKAERRGYILIILSVVILDQLSKYLIKTRLGFGSFPLIDNLLYITIVRNTGAAFGMFKDTNFLLTIITVILIVFALR